MRSSQRHYNTSCSESFDDAESSLCHEESDIELHTVEDSLQGPAHGLIKSRAKEAHPLPVDPVKVPQAQNMWQRKHNRFVLDALRMQ